MPKKKTHWKSFNSTISSKSEFNISTKGRKLEDVLLEEQNKKDEEYRDKVFLMSMTDAKTHGKFAMKTKKIYLVHFSTFLLTRDDKVVPAEGALLEFSVNSGITKCWHSYLEPGEIPMGTRSDCYAKAQKTHLLPLDDENLFINSYEDVLDDINNILMSQENYEIQPVFCLTEEKREIKLVLDEIYHRGGAEKDMAIPKVYNLEDWLFYLEKSMKNEPEFAYPGNESVKGFASNTAALYKLQNNNFKEIPACSFHEEHYKSEFCSLAIVRNRAFTIMDRLCDVSNVLITVI